MNASELGELLRRERTRRSERQVDTAARFGITQPSYHRWERGDSRPDDAHFAEVARFLGIKVDEVWQLVHGASPEPTSLNQLREQVDGLQRDIDDLRTLVRELMHSIVEAAAAEPAPPTRSRR